MSKKLKFGILGAYRGVALAKGAQANGIQVTALCDIDEAMLRKANRELGGNCQLFTDYQKMLESDIDAVLLANYATEHAGAAIQALAADKHVLSECMACFTMAEAVQLVEAVERSSKIYMLSENYPFWVQNIELKRLFDSGKYGKFIYGEGEYIHPISAKYMATLYSGQGHWRTWLAGSYYSTHSMGPIMNITGTRPVSVNGFMFPYDYDDPEMTNSLRISDSGSVLMCKMDNDAVVKIIPWSMLRDHGQRYRICCNKGAMEWSQGDPRIRIHTEPYDFPNEVSNHTYYDAQFPLEHSAAAEHGHGGGDYFTSYYFVKAIETGKIIPRLDVYSAIDMTVIGIQGYRSILNNSNTMEIPDFRLAEMREKYRNDHWNNDPARQGAEVVPSSVLGEIKVSPNAKKLFMEERKKYDDLVAQKG